MKPHNHKEKNFSPNVYLKNKKGKNPFQNTDIHEPLLRRLISWNPPDAGSFVWSVREVSCTLSMVTGTLTGHLVSANLTCTKPYVVPHELCCSQPHNQDSCWTAESL